MCNTEQQKSEDIHWQKYCILNEGTYLCRSTNFLITWFENTKLTKICKYANNYSSRPEWSRQHEIQSHDDPTCYKHPW